MKDWKEHTSSRETTKKSSKSSDTTTKFGKDLTTNFKENTENLGEMHNEIDKKICQRVFEKIKDCKWDNSTICGELKNALTKNSDVKPIYVDYKSGRVDIYFDSKVCSKDYWSWNKIWWIIITVLLKPTESCWWVFEPYIWWPEELDYAWNWEWGIRPVKIRHYDNKSHYDSHNKSKELLEEKIKLYESL
jgi:hypothetical protein